MERPSSIDRLPEEVRSVIGQLRIQGRTIDEILDHLRALDVDVSRSALGRHVKRLAALRERMRNSREVATALVGQFGDQPDNKLQRLNIEMLHGIVLQTMAATVEDEDGEPQPVTFSPEDAMFLASSLQKLAGASKTDAELTIKLKAEALKEAAARVDKAAKKLGWSAETARNVRAEILGVKVEAAA